MKLKSLLVALATSLLFYCCTGTFYVVRHADRLNNSDNTPLSAFGFERANTLRDTLLNKGIDTIFVSTKLRTQQTAQPLAQAVSKPIRIYNSDTLSSFINSLAKIKRDVLLVGHSEQIPQIVFGLSGQQIDPIGSFDFDNMYIIKIQKNFLGVTSKHLTVTRYGRITP